MSHVLQCDDLLTDFFLRQLFAADMFVFQMVWAVQAAVDAIVGQIQRCEHDDAVAVKGKLDLLCNFIHFLDFFRNVTGQKHGGFPMRQSFTVNAVSGFFRTCFLKQGIDELNIVLVFLGVAQCVEDFLVVDKLFCF